MDDVEQERIALLREAARVLDDLRRPDNEAWDLFNRIDRHLSWNGHR
jgi:hypothetical protein